MEKLKVVSLFSGCGGMDLGILGGFTFLEKKYSKNPTEIVFANDLEQSFCEIFEANFDYSVVKDDIRKISSSRIPQHDILIAGFPCQSFSIVAQNPPRIGLDSEIGQLFFEVVRILKNKKPTCFIAENVKGILSANNGKAFPLIRRELEKIGYTVSYKVLNSEDFGIPQKRERVFIIGFLNKYGIKPVFPNTLKHVIPLKEVLTDSRLLDKKYYFSNKAVRGLKKANPAMNKGRVQNKNKTCATVGAHLAKVSLNSTDPVLLENKKYRRFTPREVARIQSFPDSFKLLGTEGNQYRTLGNAVPPVLMWHVSRMVIKQIKQIHESKKIEKELILQINK